MTDLTDRMRTCAAAIVAGAPDQPFMEWQLVYRDAADLLIEASNALESAKETLERGAYDLRDGGYLRSATILDEEAKNLKGTPMEYMLPWVENPLPTPPQTDLWIAPGGPLPGMKQSGTISPRACPKCDSRANKRVSRQGTHLMLVCPVCAHVWPYMKEPPTAGAAGG